MKPNTDNIDYHQSRIEKWQRAAELHRSGISIKQIASELQVSPRTIFRWLNQPITKLRSES